MEVTPPPLNDISTIVETSRRPKTIREKPIHRGCSIVAIIAIVVFAVIGKLVQLLSVY
jgi:hypothetical protein